MLRQNGLAVRPEYLVILIIHLQENLIQNLTGALLILQQILQLKLLSVIIEKFISILIDQTLKLYKLLVQRMIQ